MKSLRLEKLPYMTNLEQDTATLDVPGLVSTTQHMMQRCYKEGYKAGAISACKLELDRDARIAVVGDIHGGLCDLRSFLLRLRKLNFFKDYENGTAYALRENHYVVSLGDFVDYGKSSLQAAHLLMALKTNIKDNWGRCFILNGNHEDHRMYSNFSSSRPASWGPFLQEYLTREVVPIVDGQPSEVHWHPKNDAGSVLMKTRLIQFPNHPFCQVPIFEPFEYLYTVLFARYEDNAWLQLCHGGIDEKLAPNLRTFLQNADRVHAYFNPAGNESTGLKWSDSRDTKGCGTQVFEVPEWGPCRGCISQKHNDISRGWSCKEPSTRGSNVWVYSTACTVSYLRYMDICMLVRGHQDNVRGYMTVPVHNSIKKPRARVGVVVYTYPLTKKGSKPCKSEYTIERETVPIASEITAWEEMTDCTGYDQSENRNVSKYFTNNGYFVEQSYQQCVGPNRCESFDKGNPYAQSFHSDHVAVVTSATCSQSKGTHAQNFVVLHYVEDPPLSTPEYKRKQWFE